MSAIDPGRLNRRVVLEAPVEVPDGAGGVTRGYSEVGKIWAEVTPLPTRGDVVADASGATANWRILVRAGSAITTQHRLRDGARVFALASIIDLDGRYLDIRATEAVA